MNVKSSSKPILFSIHVIAPIIAGASIYALFRPGKFVFSTWLQVLGLWSAVSSLRVHTLQFRHLIPSWLLFSLPDGLWVYAATAAMTTIWSLSSSYQKFPWVCLPFIVAIASELGQKASIIPGTFDLMDLTFDMIGFIAALLIRFPINKDKKVLV